MISKHSRQAPALICPLSSLQLHMKPPSWGSYAVSATGLVHPYQPDSPAIQVGKALEGSVVTSFICGYKDTSVEAGRVRRVWSPPPTASPSSDVAGLVPEPKSETHIKHSQVQE